MIFAGVDSSTQETKVLVLDAGTGQIVARGRAPHEVRGAGGERVSDPGCWWRALREALARTGAAARIEAIAVAAQQHGLVVLDARGEPLLPAPLWNDTTSAPDARSLLADLGGADAWASHTGCVPVAALTVCKWARLRRLSPALADAARAVRLPHEYLTERLCGRAAGDRGDASGTGWFSPRRDDYASEVLELERVRLDRGLLADVHAGADPVGRVSPQAASELGLRAGTLVAAGSGDNMAAAVGVALAPGSPVISLGTSGTAYALAEQPVEDPSGVLAGFADAGRRFLPLACTLNATLAVERFAAWLGLERDDVEPAGKEVVLPYLQGERTPDLPAANALVTGLTPETTRRQILQAAYDGAVEALMLGLERLERLAGVQPRAPLVLIGGGAAGGAWRETVARMSGRALEVPAEHEQVALGAAALAAAAAGGGDATAIAAGWGARAGERTDPVERDEVRLRAIRAARERGGGLLRGGAASQGG